MTNIIVLSLFFFIATVVGLAASFMVLFSKRNYSKSFFFGMFLFSLAVFSIYNFYLSVNVFKDFPDLFMITKSFIFLAAPCAFLYVRSTLLAAATFKKYDWFHFLPFLIYFSLTTIVWIGNSTGLYFADYISAKIKCPFSMLSLSVWLIYAFCQTLMVLNYDIKKFSKKQLKPIKILGWIRVYNLMTLFLFSTLFVHFFLLKTSNLNTCYILISSVLVFTVGCFYFKPQIFCDVYDTDFVDFIDDDLVAFASKESKNSLSGIKELTQEKKQVYLAKLDLIFVSKKLYLKKDLVIRDIAEETGITVNNLSSLINSEFNLHFQDYINLKRIEYFKEKINDSDWKDLSLEGMAWASGFKSRTTCFRAFVKHTGKSPSEYFKVIRTCPDKNNPYFFKQSTN